MGLVVGGCGFFFNFVYFFKFLYLQAIVSCLPLLSGVCRLTRSKRIVSVVLDFSLFKD